MIASEKPRSSMIIASTQYITPIRLWSTDVIHSRHRYGQYPLMVTQPRYESNGDDHHVTTRP